MTSLVCGLDLGGTKLLGLVVDPSCGEPLAVAKRPSGRGTEAVLDGIVGLVTDLVAAVAVDHPGATVDAVGVGAPGLVDRSGVLRYGPNLPGVVDLPLATVLAERLGRSVVVDNDATCAAWAEHERGAARGLDHSVTVTLGTGIGGGITVEGQLLRGAHGYGGELGHMVVDPSGPQCPCGRVGCWERFASGSALGRYGREAAAAGRGAAIVASAGGRVDDVRGEHVTAAAAGGDADARAVVDQFAGWVALGIANLVNVLDTEIVVVGGGLVEAGELLMEPVRRAYADQLVGVGHREAVPVVAAELGERAGAWGAALLAAART